MDDGSVCLTSVLTAYCSCVLVPAACVFECQNQDLLSSSRWVILAQRCFVVSCAFTGIVYQGLARPCSMDLSVSPQDQVDALVVWPMISKNGVFWPRFVRTRGAGWPFLCLEKSLTKIENKNA